MQQTKLSEREAVDSGFIKQVIEQSGVNINRCYQCLTCTLSCPVAFTMDYLPHQIIRMIQRGDKKRVLGSSTLWICASCETCGARCPNEIAFPHVIDTLRHIAITEKIKFKKASSPIFHHIFLNSIKKRGKQYELGMLIELKLKTRDLFSDLLLGMKMLLKGKLSFFPGHIKGHKEVSNLFTTNEVNSN